jgi:hypothetical protein
MDALTRLTNNPPVTVRRPGPPDPDGTGVGYWMQRSQRGIDDPALDVADKYELDGRDPNGYMGIAWSIGPRPMREVVGKPLPNEVVLLQRAKRVLKDRAIRAYPQSIEKLDACTGFLRGNAQQMRRCVEMERLHRRPRKNRLRYNSRCHPFTAAAAPVS